MAFVGIQSTVDCYMAQEADLTNQVSDILSQITIANRKNSSIAYETQNKKTEVREKYTVGSEEYSARMEEINEEYSVKLADIQSWESELEEKKQVLETELQATTATKESFQSALKQNVQKDFKYAQN